MKKEKAGPLKKTMIVIGVVLFLAFTAAAVAPLFWDLNKKVKPLLIKALEKNLNAKVSMGDISLTLYRRVNFKIETLRIRKDKLIIDTTDMSFVMPYSVLRQNPSEWMNKIKMEIAADEISLNQRKLVVSNFKSDFLKEAEIIKLKNMSFDIFQGRGKSYLEMDLSQGLKAIYEFEVKDGKWPVGKIKASAEKKVSKIPKASQMISDLDIDDNFESIKGNVLIQSGITHLQSLEMNIPTSKANINAEGIINEKNALRINGNFILPLDNVPEGIRASDGRGKIPFEILGTTDAANVNWQKTIDVVVRAYSKDEGKKIIKREVERLKEKLQKDEKLKELIKGIKF